MAALIINNALPENTEASSYFADYTVSSFLNALAAPRRTTAKTGWFYMVNDEGAVELRDALSTNKTQHDILCMAVPLRAAKEYLYTLRDSLDRILV